MTNINFDIKSNKLVEEKIESSLMLQDLIIPPTLLTIFTFNILTSQVLVNYQHAKVRKKEIENSRFSSTICSKKFTSEQRGNIIYLICLWWFLIMYQSRCLEIQRPSSTQTKYNGMYLFDQHICISDVYISFTQCI